jgi:hypothetical protein
MRLFALCVVGLALVAIEPAPARGEPGFGSYVVAIGEGLAGTTEPVHTPVAAVAAGWGTEGFTQSVAVGWAWGSRQIGGLFPGSKLSRIQLDGRHARDRSSLAATFGWYDNTLVSLGIDAGVRADPDGAGPTARLSLGIRGVVLRLAGGVDLGHPTRVVGSAELAVELLDLIGVI